MNVVCHIYCFIGRVYCNKTSLLIVRTSFLLFSKKRQCQKPIQFFFRNISTNKLADQVPGTLLRLLLPRMLLFVLSILQTRSSKNRGSVINKKNFFVPAMDTVYPEPMSLLHRRLVPKKRRGSSGRYRTQPVTFSEIKVPSVYQPLPNYQSNRKRQGGRRGEHRRGGVGTRLL